MTTVITISFVSAEEGTLRMGVTEIRGDVPIQHPLAWLGDLEEYAVKVEIEGKKRTITIGKVEPESEGQG